jgi:hypothetical protein
MNYTELVKGVNAYATGNRNRENSFPQAPHGREERDYLETQTTSVPLIDRIYCFLQKWNRRVGINRNDLENALRQISSVNLPSQIISVNFEDPEVRVKIRDAFMTISYIVKSTGASKTLHIFQPKSFVMWDDAIRKNYGCHSNAEGYLNFLWRSKWEIQEIITTYQQYSGCNNVPNVIENIEKRLYVDGWKSITKLLDEYNFARYTKKWI